MLLISPEKPFWHLTDTTYQFFIHTNHNGDNILEYSRSKCKPNWNHKQLNRRVYWYFPIHSTIWRPVIHPEWNNSATHKSCAWIAKFVTSFVQFILPYIGIQKYNPKPVLGLQISFVYDQFRTFHPSLHEFVTWHLTTDLYQTLCKSFALSAIVDYY